MTKKTTSGKSGLPRGVMLNAYPDSIGKNLADTVSMLQRPELQDAFPTRIDVVKTADGSTVRVA